MYIYIYYVYIYILYIHYTIIACNTLTVTIKLIQTNQTSRFSKVDDPRKQLMPAPLVCSCFAPGTDRKGRHFAAEISTEPWTICATSACHLAATALIRAVETVKESFTQLAPSLHLQASAKW